MQAQCRKMWPPLPLGEGWGEGLAMKRDALFPPLTDRIEVARDVSFLFLLLSYALTPPLPEGEASFT
jgi:hypothetical protein